MGALGSIPAAGDVPGYRLRTLPADGLLGREMRRVERDHAAGALAAAPVAELWAWAAYLEHVRGYRSATTVAQYVRSVARLLAWAAGAGYDYTALTPPQFDGWQKHLAMALGHSASWRMRQVCAVRSFFAWRSSRGLGDHVARDLQGPREPIRMPRKYTVDQLRAMAQAVAELDRHAHRLRDMAILLLLLSTGARREELINIDLGDLHLGKRSGVVRFHGKGAKEREVPFEGPVVDALAAWLAERGGIEGADPDAVFLTLPNRKAQRGLRLRPQAVDRIITRHARSGGLREWGVHRFRVTFATALYDDGAGIEEIRLLMGHEDIETTRRYLSVSERMRRTRLKPDRQHEVLGTRNVGKPRWLRALHGDTGE